MTGNRRPPGHPDLRSDNLRPVAWADSGFNIVMPSNPDTEITLVIGNAEDADEDERDRREWDALVRPLVLAWARSMDEKGRQYPPVVEEC